MKIHYFPSESGGNKYLELQREIWGQIAEDCSAIISNLSFNILKRKKKVAIFNWLEDMPSYSRYPTLRFVKCILIVIYARLFYGQCIYVKHNKNPHLELGSIYFKILSYLQEALFDKCVCHRKVENKKYIHIEHPMYPGYESTNKEIEYGIFGRINEYKGIFELLKIWDRDKRLTIRGQCKDKKLHEKILNIISCRGLDVDYINKDLSEEEIQCFLKITKFVVISHKSSTALVSGMVYHAASFGCNLLFTRSDMGLYFSNRFSFCNMLVDNDDIPYIKDRDVIKEMKRHASIDILASSWERVIYDKRI